MIDHKKLSLANQIFEIIEKEILHGKYPQGTILDESLLSAELRVGRSTIKEAMIKLEAEKLIVETVSGYKVLGITEDDLKDMYDVKRKIEVAAAVQAAKRMSDVAVAELGLVIYEQEQSVNAGNAEQARNLDTRFHDLIYAASGSTTYEIILSPIHHKLAKYRKVSLESKSRGIHALEEHKAIYEAIAARDFEAVEKQMLAHIDNAYSRIINANEEE